MISQCILIDIDVYSQILTTVFHARLRYHDPLARSIIKRKSRNQWHYLVKKYVMFFLICFDLESFLFYIRNKETDYGCSTVSHWPCHGAYKCCKIDMKINIWINSSTTRLTCIVSFSWNTVSTMMHTIGCTKVHIYLVPTTLSRNKQETNCKLR